MKATVAGVEGPRRLRPSQQAYVHQQRPAFSMQSLTPVATLTRSEVVSQGLTPQMYVAGRVYFNAAYYCFCGRTSFLLAGESPHELQTPTLSPPEDFFHEPITLAADIWTLGVSLYEILGEKVSLQNVQW